MGMYEEGKNRNMPVRMRKGDSEESPVNQGDYISTKKLTQEEKLFNAWERGIEVSQLNAIMELGIGHLSSVISAMIHKEHIHGIMKTTHVSPSGARYMAYSMPADLIPEARRQYRRQRLINRKEKGELSEHTED